MYMYKKFTWITSDFILLILGQTVSRMGSIFYRVVISWYIYKITNSAFCLSLYLFVETVPRIVLKPIIGSIIGYINKLKIIIYTDLLNGLLILGVSYFTWNVSQKSAFFVLLFFGFAKGIFDAFFSIAINTIFPEIIIQNNLDKAFSLNQSSYQFAGIFGLTLGSLIFDKFGVTVCMLLNGLSYLLSAFSELFIKYKSPKRDFRGFVFFKKSIVLQKILQYKQFLINNKMTVGKVFFISGAMLVISSPLINPILLATFSKYNNTSITSITFVNLVMSVFSLFSGMIFSLKDRWNVEENRLISFNFLIIAIVYFLLLVATIRKYISSFVFVALICCAFAILAMISPIISSLFYKKIIINAKNEYKNETIALYGFTNDIAQNVGVLVMGSLFDVNAYICILCGLVISTLVILYIRKVY